METARFTQAVDEFITYCRSRGLAPRTVELYRESLEVLEAFLGGGDAPLP